ncbi:SDR family NAD(P)-dependent oxidoreductase [Sulfitobacter sp. M368]|jgi:NAD(P)-dependent dehydrogenase (short-subunit alcohol dehydrogenase family)|uniref:SDR family NAD(P)-dependent oxidoreductase n=1 Tax=Sulfitobacter sp. M368 TaxID=2867021 RepID=UPI0021A5D886|nr:SDR family oxidoreductase [Sulfitobacter sp. M368]UWR15499.1 SDR family oxidoreductase [Sulfitobacter sp. M368]
MQDINGYSLLVTGGGSGIGAEVARYFAARGARVTITGRRAEKIEAVSQDIGPNCIGIAGDVTNADDRARMIEVAVAHGGGLQGLFNNAGNMLRGSICDLDADDILNVLNTNVVAGMALTGLAVPHLEQSGGAVLFVGSVHTRRAFPGASPYAASKGAVEVLSQVLAAELGPKRIRVNCVLPGAVPTEINVRAGLAADEAENQKRLQSMAEDHPLGRIGTATEIAEAADYLLRSEWTTGTSIVVDGGLALGVSYK